MSLSDNTHNWFSKVLIWWSILKEVMGYTYSISWNAARLMYRLLHIHDLSGMYTKTLILRLKAGDTFLNVDEGIFDTLRKSAEWRAYPS
jgi:hypothetical protein